MRARCQDYGTMRPWLSRPVPITASGVTTSTSGRPLPKKTQSRTKAARAYPKDSDYRQELEPYLGRRVLIEAARWKILTESRHAVKICAYGPVLTRFCGRYSRNADIHIGHMNILIDKSILMDYNIQPTDTLVFQGILHEYINHGKSTRNVGLWVVTTTALPKQRTKRMQKGK